MNTRQSILEQVALEIQNHSNDEVTVVAIDGVDGAGKTHFADELADVLRAKQQLVVRASVDSFHNRRDVRYRLGKDSPVGFFQDSYNYDLLCSSLLEPLHRTGSKLVRLKEFDHVTDSEIQCEQQEVKPSTILLFDGIFLHRPELTKYWHYSIFLDVPFSISIPRGAQRGDGSPDPEAESNNRYVAGQRIYLETCNPIAKASIVLNNSDLRNPIIETSSLKLNL
jgi:uridine kinase